MKTKKETRKAVALFFIIIMLGSTFTYALFSIFSPTQSNLNIPNERILNYKLSDQQRQVLISKGYTLVEYYYPSNCFECLEVKQVLEDVTKNSEEQVFLQELEENTNNTILTITNILNQTTIENPTPKEAMTTLCNFLINTPLWCITSQI